MQVFAKAEFTEDMATMLYRVFNDYQSDGIVTLEVATNGLWLIHPFNASRQFLGLARLDQATATRPHGVGITSAPGPDD